MGFEFRRGTAFQKIGSHFLSTRVIDSSCRYILETKYGILHPIGKRPMGFSALNINKKGRHLNARLNQSNNLLKSNSYGTKTIQISSANILSFKSVVFILITVSSNLATIFMNAIGNHSPLYIQYFVA